MNDNQFPNHAMQGDRPRENQHGFTLVELLVVITIIGILAGLAVKGISSAIRAAQAGRMSIEVSNLATAVEAYKQKYGDYPPDFSDRLSIERHYRKAFPKILNSEINLIANARLRYSSGIPLGIDTAEALVFCLGGYSDDPQRPFTGAGGPLLVLPAPAHASLDKNTNGKIDGIELTYIDNYQYNSDRKPGVFEFDVGRLTLTTDVIPLRSFDDIYDPSLTLTAKPVWDPTLGNNNPPSGDYAPGIIADPFPVYRPKDREMPYVYFNAKTYGFIAPVNSTTNDYYYNSYRPRSPTAGDEYLGVARPYKSTQLNTAALSGTSPYTLLSTAADKAKAGADALRFYEKKDSFQIICAGYDGHYGGVYDPLPTGSASAAAVNFIAGTGEGFRVDIVLQQSQTWPLSGDMSILGVDGAGSQFKYDLSQLPATEQLALETAGNPQQDNLTSFADGEIANSLP